MDVAQWLEEHDELIASERVLPTRKKSHFNRHDNRCMPRLYTNLNQRSPTSCYQGDCEELMCLITVTNTVKHNKKGYQDMNKELEKEEQIERCFATSFNRETILEIHGTILGHKVAAIIDLGATSNFIS